MAYWIEALPMPAGRDTRLKEVKETLTDQNGQWSIEGEDWETNPDYEKSFLSQTYFTLHPEFIIFKPGYCPWPKGFSIQSCKGKIKPRGNGKIVEGEDVELLKLVSKKDRLNLFLAPEYGTDPEKEREFLKKQINFLGLLNCHWTKFP